MLLVKNAKVYAPEYLGVKDILIAGGRIERIADHLPEYEGCEVIDGTGKIDSGYYRPPRPCDRRRWRGKLPHSGTAGPAIQPDQGWCDNCTWTFGN